MSKKVLIVGGVAGGASAAARLRRLDENAEIIMFERDEYISFANCGLPYYIGETIKDREKLLVQTPGAMRKRFNIDVRINSEVMGVDTDNKVVRVKSKERGIYEESYDYLVLSPGAKPLRPNIEGVDSGRIFTLRNIPDTDRIKEYVDNRYTESAVIVGGGYIGVEMAENLRARGLKVTLVEAAPHILAPFDSDMVVIGERELQENGVELILNDGVKCFSEKEDFIETMLNSGTKLCSSMVILAIGITPDTKFLADSGIELGTKGHIIVNEKMETNKKGVYAVGDAIEVIDFITGSKIAVPLAGPANKQGRIAADNIAGLETIYKGTQGTSIIKIFNLTAACTGNNERMLKSRSIPYKVVYAHPFSHASYYPNAAQMSIKLIFDNEGRILGSQIFGYDGVDKRIDILATVIRFKGTVQDLTELELSYAPPYSSAKDPVNMAGYIAQNVLEGRMDVINSDEILDYDKENSILLDVRTGVEYNNGHLEGAVNIPVDSLRQRLDELDNNKEIVEYCQVGLRGYIAARILEQNGFNVKNLTGGYKSFSANRFKPKPMEFKNKDDNGNNKTAGKNNIGFDREIDACGSCSSGAVMMVEASIKELKDGDTLKVTTADQGFSDDIKLWCDRTNNELLDLTKEGSKTTAFIKKNNKQQ